MVPVKHLSGTTHYRVDPLCYKVSIDILTAQTRKWRLREAKYLIDRECAV